MFDDPKKELERLQAQLLAAEDGTPEAEDFDGTEEDIYNEFAEEPFDAELDALLNGNSSGYNDEYVMDEDRYVAASKKSNTGLIVFALIQSAAVVALVIWALRYLL